MMYCQLYPLKSLYKATGAKTTQKNTRSYITRSKLNWQKAKCIIDKSCILMDLLIIQLSISLNSIVCECIDYFKSLKNFEGLMYWSIFGDRYFAIEAALLQSVSIKVTFRMSKINMMDGCYFMIAESQIFWVSAI